MRYKLRLLMRPYPRSSTLPNARLASSHVIVVSQATSRIHLVPCSQVNVVSEHSMMTAWFKSSYTDKGHYPSTLEFGKEDHIYFRVSSTNEWSY
jgi:hypothetical protein